MFHRPPKTSLQTARRQTTANVKSIPFHKRNPQTTLYLLRKQKDRYANELLQLQQRQAELQGHILKIQTDIQEVIENWHTEMKEIGKELQYDQHLQEQKQWKIKPMKY